MLMPYAGEDLQPVQFLIAEHVTGVCGVHVADRKRRGKPVSPLVVLPFQLVSHGFSKR